MKDSLSHWSEQLQQGIDGLNELDQDVILDVAKQAAHTVARPAAPLTTYALGVAVGRGMPMAEAKTLIQTLLSQWDAAGVVDER